LHGWAPVVYSASKALAAGRLDEAEELIEQAAPLGAVLGETNDVIVWTQMLSVAVERARYDDARRLMDQLEGTVLGLAGGWRMLVLSESGDRSEATAAHAAWARDIRPLVPQVIMPWVLDAETAVAYRAGDTQLAARLRDDVAPYAGHMLGGDTALLGAGDYLIGRVAFVEGRSDDAVAATTRAIEIADRWAFERLATHHRIDFARALRARDATGDAELARTTLTQALETAERLGLAAAAIEAHTLLS